jgi:16S rRNA (cytosine967-C5)-methyltransferase
MADATVKSFLKPVFSKSKINNNIATSISDLKFDKIFIDAPCSALGTSAKNPDAKYNKNFEDITRLKNNSLKILQNCDEYLKIGGRIVFYTCTLSGIENFEVIESFLKLNNDKYKIYSIDTKKIFNDLSFDNKIKYSSGQEGYFEIMPYYFKSEGATVCSIIKIA